MLTDVRQKIRQKFKQGPKMSNFGDSKLELGERRLCSWDLLDSHLKRATSLSH